MTRDHAMQQTSLIVMPLVGTASGVQIEFLASGAPAAHRAARSTRTVVAPMIGTFGRRVVLLGILAANGCVSSPANPLLLCLDNNPDPKGEARIVRGVVNGLWRYDPEKTLAHMAKYDEHLTPEQRQEYAGRYIVRVGVKRGPPIEFLSPIALGKWVEYVVLPEGWSHDALAVASDPKVINVGDVVDVWAQKGRYYNFLNALVRQCDAPPTAGETKDWNIGCKTYEDFDKQGFAGDHHYFRSF